MTVDTELKMKEFEYKQLEHLLGKLRSEIGTDFGIVPNYVQDGYLIWTYDSKGDLNKKVSSYDIESCLNKIKGVTEKPFKLTV